HVTGVQTCALPILFRCPPIFPYRIPMPDNLSNRLLPAENTLLHFAKSFVLICGPPGSFRTKAEPKRLFLLRLRSFSFANDAKCYSSFYSKPLTPPDTTSFIASVALISNLVTREALAMTTCPAKE